MTEYAVENADRIAFLIQQHLLLVGLSMAGAVITGLTLGGLIATPVLYRFRDGVLSISAAAHAIPPVAVIAVAFLFAGIGARPVIVALYFYSIVPVLFNAVAGLTSVDPATVNAGKGLGFTELQILTKVRFPLAAPVILAGIRSAATINVGAATIAAIIGGGGLGDLIFMGLKLYRIDMILIGAVLCALLALFIDGILVLLQRRLLKAIP
jgi:osmoprotectant transport system permease protein